jgi:hypothetical protein
MKKIPERFKRLPSPQLKLSLPLISAPTFPPLNSRRSPIRDVLYCYDESYHELHKHTHIRQCTISKYECTHGVIFLPLKKSLMPRMNKVKIIVILNQ